MDPSVPWTVDRYPASMKNLPVAWREKAIEIANALLADGHSEGQAIRIGIARAKAWGCRRGLTDLADRGSNADFNIDDWRRASQD